MNKEKMNKEFLTCDAERAKELICLGVNPHYTDEKGRNAFYYAENDDEIIVLTKDKIDILLENGVSPLGLKQEDLNKRRLNEKLRISDNERSAMGYHMFYTRSNFSVINDLIDRKCFSDFDIQNMFHPLGYNEKSKYIDKIAYLEKINKLGFVFDDNVFKRYFKNGENRIYEDNVIFDLDIIKYYTEKGFDFTKKNDIEYYNGFDEEYSIKTERFYDCLLYPDYMEKGIPTEFIYNAMMGNLDPEIDINNIDKSWMACDEILNTVLNNGDIQKFIDEGKFKEVSVLISLLVHEDYYFRSVDTYRDLFVKNIIPEFDNETKHEIYKYVDFEEFNYLRVDDCEDEDDYKINEFCDFMMKEYSQYEAEIIKNAMDSQDSPQPVKHNKRRI